MSFGKASSVGSCAKRGIMESSGGKKSVTLIDGRGGTLAFLSTRDNTGNIKGKTIYHPAKYAAEK